jgi:predicted negative regulator of RcsB-dependent stress response
MDNRDNNYNDDSNTSLYLVLGGLLVVAIVFGFAYWGRHSNNNLNNLEPAAGTPYSATTTTPDTTGNTDNTGYGTNTNNTNNTGTGTNNTSNTRTTP